MTKSNDILGSVSNVEAYYRAPKVAPERLVRHLTCCCCGESAGTFEQHWNRDTGYGICAKCIAWIRAGKRETEDEIRKLYGVEGVNFAAPTA